MTPDEVMTWTRVVLPGLGTAVRTFVLTPRAGMNLLLVRDEIRGSLTGIVRSTFSTKEDVLNDHVIAVKQRAELLG